jgi:dipeptidyl aminopeptidase/acylaminoacyl peptidase
MTRLSTFFESTCPMPRFVRLRSRDEIVQGLSRWVVTIFMYSLFYIQDSASFAVETGSPMSWTPELMMQVKRVGSVQVSSNGKSVLFTVREALLDNGQSEYRTQIHLTHLDGSPSRQLTHGDKSCDDPQWSPDGRWVAFVSSRIGKKNLWVIPSDGGESIQLTESKSDIGSFRWSPLGQSLAFTAIDANTDLEERNLKEKNDVKVVDENVKLNRLSVIDFNPAGKHPSPARQLTTGNLSVASEARAGRSGYDWSPDATQIVFAHTTSPRPDDWPSADISLLNLASSTVKPLVHSRSAETSPLFSPDGKLIAYTSSDDPPSWGGVRSVYTITASDGTATKLSDTYDGFGRYSELVGWSADGGQIYFTEVRGTRMRLMALPLKEAPVEFSHPGLLSTGMSLSGISLNATRTHFGFGWEKLDQPIEAVISRVTNFEPQVVSQVNVDLPKPQLGRTEVIRWKSTEDFEIEGLLTYPVGYEPGTRYPLLLVIHGGPMGVFTETFDGNSGTYPIAAFASGGYAVLRPNPRGSSGYGAKFRHANYNDWGGGDFRDVMSGVHHVIALGIADPDRMGIMGWSYGGFMTSWAITQTKRFRAASVGAGVTNLMSFTGTSDIPGFLPDYFHGEYWDKLDAYQHHSPMFQIKNVTTPTLIQHGNQDERVPLSQGEELYNALKRQGCITKMVVYPRTPHSIEEPRLLLDCMHRNLDWFDKYVAGESR